MTKSLPTKPTKTPRLQSLEHRLRHAKDADGQPIDLWAELLFFLDDPPANIGDRWQKGADLCAEHNFKTSRMAVYRFYRANIMQWRREENPPSSEPAPTPEEVAKLENEVRYLAAQRALEMLNDPRLSPAQLVSLIRNDTRRQQISLTRDQFHDRRDQRLRAEHKEYIQKQDDKMRQEVLDGMNLDPKMKMLTGMLAKSL